MKTNEKILHKTNSIRIPDFDYSSENYYFITICSFQKKKIFSEIKNERIILNNIGEVINEEIKNTEIIRKNVIINEFVIMPNHIHIIIVISSQICGKKSLHRSDSTNNMKPNSLSSIINQIKSKSTKRVRKSINCKINIWQPRFYEHIIRNDKELYEIRTYIKNNPIKWSNDEYY